jgi:hypothetical protein
MLGERHTRVRDHRWTHLASSRPGDAPARKPSYCWAMGLRRHRSGESEGERFLMRQKLLSIGDAFWIENEQGERACMVNGKAIRLRQTFVLEDGSGDEGGPDPGAQAQHPRQDRRPARWRHRRDRPQGAGRDPSSLRHRRRARHRHEGPRKRRRPRVRDRARRRHRRTISKKWFRVRDSYGVDVATGEDAPSSPRSPSPSIR